MSQWANEHPEEMAEIAALPLDRIRDEYKYDRVHCHRDLSTPSPGGEAPLHSSSSGSPSPGVDPSVDPGCPNCEAPAGEPCQHWCHWEAIS